MAVGAPAAASDRMTAAVVVMRWVVVMSTCFLLLCDRGVRSMQPGRCARLVEKRSISVQNR
jgi:hypothetical protein